MLSASWGAEIRATVFISENEKLSTSPERLQFSGVQFGSRGSDPEATSTPSEKPSPSVSGLNGSVPIRISWASLKPSPSQCMVEEVALLRTTENLLAAVGNTLELPTALVATTTKFPNAFVLVVRIRMAEVPLGSIVVVPATIVGGANAGIKENV